MTTKTVSPIEWHCSTYSDEWKRRSDWLASERQVLKYRFRSSNKSYYLCRTVSEHSKTLNNLSYWLPDSQLKTSLTSSHCTSALWVGLSPSSLNKLSSTTDQSASSSRLWRRRDTSDVHLIAGKKRGHLLRLCYLKRWWKTQLKRFDMYRVLEWVRDRHPWAWN
jgi:hypothetical protein